jgi:hypothetical protein
MKGANLEMGGCFAQDEAIATSLDASTDAWIMHRTQVEVKSFSFCIQQQYSHEAPRLAAYRMLHIMTRPFRGLVAWFF